MPRVLFIAMIVVAIGGLASYLLLDGAAPEPELDLGLNDAAPRLVDPKVVPVAATGTPTAVRARAFEEEEEVEDEPLASVVTVVQVVDEDGISVAGAEVEVLRPNTERRRGGPGGGPAGFFAMMSGEGEEPTERVLQSGESGSDGRVYFGRLPDRRLSVRARNQGFVGSGVIDPEEAAEGELEVKVVLRPTKLLTVKVTDPGGAPRGPLRVRVQASEGGNPGNPFGGRGGDRGRRMRRAMGRTLWTNPKDGVAQIEITPENGDLYEAEELRVSATVFGGEGPEQTVRPVPAQETKVALEVPFGVDLRVKLLTPEGEKPEDEMMVTWRVRTEDRDGGNASGGRGGRGGRGNRWMNSWGSRRSRDGEVLILGLPLASTVTLSTRGGDRTEAELEHKVASSARVEEVPFTLGGLLPLVKAELLNERGDSLARRRLEMRIESEGSENEDPRQRWRRQMNRPVRTDENGKLELRVQPGASGKVSLFERGQTPGFRGGFFGRGGQQNEAPLEAVAIAVISYPALIAGDVHDAGRLAIDRGPLLISGRVLGADGKPLSEMSVRVRAQADQGADRNGRGGRRGFGRGNRGGEQRTRTDAEGRFAIHARAQGTGTFEVSANGRGHLTEVLPFRPGTEDLELRAVRTGGLAGKLSLANTSLGLRPEIRLERTGAEGNPERARWDRRTGEFTARDLRPGRYDVVVRINRREELRVGGIEVPSGEIVQPEALKDLLVGQAYIEALVTVIGPDGAPVRGATVEIRGGNPARGLGTRRSDEKGEARVALRPEGNESVTVRSRAHAPFSQENASFPLLVRLREPTRLVLELSETLPETGEGGARWSIVLLDPKVELPGPDADMRDWMRVVFGGRGGRGGYGTFGRIATGQTKVELRNPPIGPREIYLALLPGRRRGGMSSFTPPLRLGSVNLQPEVGTQTATLPVDNAELLVHFGEALLGGN